MSRLNGVLPSFPLPNVLFLKEAEKETGMHYYQFNIGDYASHTRHLNLLEDLAYRRLLDAYYLHEKPLDIDSTLVARQIGMREHADVVDAVLNEFFEMVDGCFVNLRADKEIQAYRGKIEQASRAGKASAERRSNARSTDVQPNIKQEPLTIKQETKNTATVVAPPDGVSQSVWNDFVKQRKAKKAPVSDTVITKIRNQAEKAGWSLEDALAEICARGWTGFNAEWVKEKQTFAQQAANVARTTVPPPPNQDAALKQIIADREKCSPPPAHIREMMKGILGVKNA